MVVVPLPTFRHVLFSASGTLERYFCRLRTHACRSSAIITRVAKSCKGYGWLANTAALRAEFARAEIVLSLPHATLFNPPALKHTSMMTTHAQEEPRLTIISTPRAPSFGLPEKYSCQKSTASLIWIRLASRLELHVAATMMERLACHRMCSPIDCATCLRSSCKW